MDRLTCLLFLLAGSPKLHAWFRNVQYEVFVLGEKSVSWCGNPAQQLIAAAVLNLCGISIGVCYADLSNQARAQLVDNFNTAGKGPMALICSYCQFSGNKHAEAVPECSLYLPSNGIPNAAPSHWSG
jgi:hypothetical protein